MADRFGGGAVTFVGDRGMIKGPQIDALQAQDGEFHYITAITKPQIETLLKQGVVQMELFDEQVAEVTTEGGIRYVLRRNPTRAAEMAETRQSKLAALEQLVKEQNAYLAEHPRASVAVARRKVEAKWKKLRLPAVDVKVDHAKADNAKADDVQSAGRTLLLSKQQEAWEESAKLDGCYCLKTDLLKETASKEVIHDR
ncbi:MAG: IS1634 family transposase, partial [Planctomycetes bacterium]|nr:IS1634 family transposase [Planctomycetota bacterium]